MSSCTGYTGWAGRVLKTNVNREHAQLIQSAFAALPLKRQDRRARRTSHPGAGEWVTSIRS